MLTAEVGYGVDAKAWGQGVGTAAIRKLIAFVHEDNIASRRLLEKAGFVQEGLLREHYLVNGIPADEAVYGLLRSDQL